MRAYVGVSLSGDCYLDPSADLGARSCRTIRVDRRADGYHVVLISRGMKWNHCAIVALRGLPVASVTEDYDPEMEEPMAKLRKLSSDSGDSTA